MDWISEPARKTLFSQGHQQWLDSFEILLQQALQETETTPIAPVYGGMAGAVIIVENKRKQEMILKLSPSEISNGEAEALQALTDKEHHCYCPDIYDHGKDWLLLEKISGRAPDSKEMLDVQFISNILVDIWQTPLQHYSGDHLGLMDYWLKDKNQDFPPELKAAELWSQQLVAQAAQEPTTHIHGDIGFHNLLITDDQQYLFLDPSGVSGPRSWDIGCLAAWSGSPKREAVKKAVYIADLVDVDQTESARWAIVRTIASSALGHRRQNYQQRDDCLQSLPELKNDFEELRSN